MATEPTFEEMRQQRAAEWAKAQRQAAADLADRQAQIAKMPDVKDAPDPGDLYGETGMLCPCSSEGFRVRRYITVNGRRYRMEVECLGCHAIKTWDFGSRTWL